MNLLNRIKELNFKQKAIGIGVFAFVLISLSTILFKVTFSTNTLNVFYGYELKNVEIDNVIISSINIKEEDSLMKYEAEINAKDDINISYINIIFKDDQNNEIVKLLGYVGSTLKSGEKKHIEASTDADLSKVKTVEYEVIKS